MEIEELRIEIEKIKERNKKVELNKAWETSWVRRISIIIVTYFVITLCLYVIHNPAPWINAVIPSMGFLLSTLTVGIVKNHWVEKIYNKEKSTNKINPEEKNIAEVTQEVVLQATQKF